MPDRRENQPPNPNRSFEYDGEKYTLNYSVLAFMRLQEHFGLASMNLVAKKLADESKLGAGDVVALVWAGLATHHEDLEFKFVARMMDTLGLDGLDELVAPALAAAMPKATGRGKKKKQ